MKEVVTDSEKKESLKKELSKRERILQKRAQQLKQEEDN